MIIKYQATKKNIKENDFYDLEKIVKQIKI